jgi:hypothetical protein
MSKLTDAYRTIGVYNAHRFARDKGNIWISYFPGDKGRMARDPCFHVNGLDIKTDPTAHWRDYGSKWISLHFNCKGATSQPERKAAALKVAQDWATKHYGIKEWARTPLGDWMDAKFVKERMAELAKQLKGAK